MDLYKLKGFGGADIIPDVLIESYNSLIWTERYREASDFQLVTEDVDNMRTVLPIKSAVSLNDSNYVMLVETHSIETNNKGIDVLTIKGRGYETFLENRTTLYSGGETLEDDGDPMSMVYTTELTTAAVAAKLVAHIGPGGQTKTFIDNNDIDVVGSTSGVSNLPTSVWRVINRDSIYNEVQRLLAENNLGIRSLRSSPDDNVINIQIYKGTNKTATVVFDARAGHFKKVSYLWSSVGGKTNVVSSSKAQSVRIYNTGASGYTGLNNRTGLADQSDVTQTGSQGTATLTARAKSYLGNNREVVIMDATLGDDQPYKYGTDYKLGDTVKIKGKYGVTVNLMVNEYVRTKDSNGETGYPGFFQPNQ